MTLIVAALVLTNLLYLVGAVAVASLVSGLYVLRHRKPKSLESSIESFSRELRALAPEHRGSADRPQPGRPRADARRADPRKPPVTAEQTRLTEPRAADTLAAVEAVAPDDALPAGAALPVGEVLPAGDAVPADDHDHTAPGGRSG